MADYLEINYSIFDSYCKYLKQRYFNKRTYLSKRNKIEKFISFIDKSLLDVTKKDVEAFKQFYCKNLKPNTTYSYLVEIQKLYIYLIANNYITKNPILVMPISYVQQEQIHIKKCNIKSNANLYFRDNESNEICERYIKECIRAGRKRSSISSIKVLLRALGDVAHASLNEMTASEIMSVGKMIKENRCSYLMFRSAARIFFRWAYRNMYIDKRYGVIIDKAFAQKVYNKKRKEVI